jgi:hypothetical protein
LFLFSQGASQLFSKPLSKLLTAELIDDQKQAPGEPPKAFSSSKSASTSVNRNTNALNIITFH